MIGLYGGSLDGEWVKEDAVDGNFLVVHIRKRKWMRVDCWSWARSEKEADAKVTYKLEGDRLVFQDHERM